MSKHSRRRFISQATKAAALAGLGTFTVQSAEAASKKGGFIHHVYFWLKNPENVDDRNKLVQGLRKLSKVSTIQEWHIGKPAETNREVIDRSYSISWMLIFKNKADQDKYQVDPIHLDFVEQCSPLWQKVVVYDTEEI